MNVWKRYTVSKAVVVLKTAGLLKPNSFEYHVKTLDNPELLYRGINANTNKWIPNSSYIHEQFDSVDPFFYEGPALMQARKQAEVTELEGGIQVIDTWSNIRYTDL